MIRRAFLPAILCLSLLLSGLTAVVAQTRMAASGDFCGTLAPSLLLDASGLPVLDGTGTTLTAPDCPACLLGLAFALPAASGAAAPAPGVLLSEPTFSRALTPFLVLLGGHARAPPRLV